MAFGFSKGIRTAGNAHLHWFAIQVGRGSALSFSGYQNATSLPTIRESDLMLGTSVNSAAFSSARRGPLNTVNTETLARLAARKADGESRFE